MDQRNSSSTPANAPSFASHMIDAHPLAFTGSGGEYFRVWIVNVLLSIVTLGLYTPWARRRTAQYFYGHTQVAGSPLEFTAPQGKMVKGFVLLVLITLAYNIAANTGQDTAVALFLLAGAVLAPFIWASAMRFRLSATRWRGLRLQFAASWREVYTASWPVFALALVWFGVFLGLQVVTPEAVLDDETGRKIPQITASMVALVALGLVLSVLCIIRLEYNYSSLLVLRSRLGQEPGRWKPIYLDFVRIWGATAIVFLLSVLALGALIGLAMHGGWLALGKAPQLGMWLFVLIALAFVGGLLALFLASAPARAYREARMFQLLWDNIGVSQVARFKCDLGTGGYVWLRIRNLLLTLLTLGLYRPFARVSEYRMKTESVTLHIKGGVDQVAGTLVRQQDGGLGDALADAAGLDLIG